MFTNEAACVARVLARARVHLADILVVSAADWTILARVSNTICKRWSFTE